MTLPKLLSLAILLFCMNVCNAQVLPNLGGQRAGISALTFLKTDVSPRASSMAAQICSAGDAYSGSWNPALVNQIKGPGFASSDRLMPAGIHQYYLAAVLPDKKQGAWGFSINTLNSGKMEKRTELQPNGTGEYFYAVSNAFGLTYSKTLSENFTLGITAKYIREQLDYFKANTAAVDLGFLYKTDYKDLRFAVVLQNFGANSTAKGPFTSLGFNDKSRKNDPYPSATVFKMGLSFIPYKKERQYLIVETQLNHPSDNAENISIGLEYVYNDILYLRTGYKINVKDQKVPVFGVGLRSRVGRHPLYIDYAAVPSKMGFINNIGVSLMINRKERTDEGK